MTNLYACMMLSFIVLTVNQHQNIIEPTQIRSLVTSQLESRFLIMLKTFHYFSQWSWSQWDLEDKSLHPDSRTEEELIAGVLQLACYFQCLGLNKCSSKSCTDWAQKNDKKSARTGFSQKNNVLIIGILSLPSFIKKSILFPNCVFFILFYLRLCILSTALQKRLHEL